MVTEMFFGRKTTRGRGVSADGDLLVSRVKEGGKDIRHALSLRVHSDVMKKLRWIIGDFVTLKLRLDDDEATQIVLTRVDGPKQFGMRLCGDPKHGGGHGTIRFSATQEQLDEIFGEATSFTASLYEQTGTACTFIRD